MGERKRDTSFTFARWVDLAAYGALAAAVVFCGAPRAFQWIAAQTVAWGVGPWANFGVAMFIGGLLAHFAHGRVRAFFGLRTLKHFVRYPPLWAAATLGGVFLKLAWARVPDAWHAVDKSIVPESDPTTSIGAVAVVLAWVLGAAATPSRRRGPVLLSKAAGGPLAASGASDELTFSSLCEDLRGDEPVADETRDRFGHLGIAERIVHRLLDGRTDASVAIIGEYGSGKTTVRELVTRRLASRSNAPRIVPISLWPYEGADAAVQGILSALVEVLAEDVNVTALAGLPQRYRDVVGDGDGVLARFADALGTPRNPAWLLARIDAIASAIDCQFVVWVEDLERFAVDSEVNPSAHEEQVAPVRALLHLIDESRNLSVILASATAALQFDVQKIARYVERIPRVDHRLARRYLHCFREGCIREGTPFIDPTPKASSSDLDLAERDDGMRRAFGARRWEHPNLTEAIVELVRTPRTLKQALRRALETWAVLRGEVDLDHVIVMSVLREAEPKVFSLIDDHIDELREGGNARSVAGLPPPTKVFEPRLGKLAQDQGRGWTMERGAAIDALIEHVFGPSNNRNGRIGERPQGLGIAGPTDYWARYQTLVAPGPGLGDQDVLRMMEERRTSELAPMLEHPTMAGVVRHFSYRLQDDDDERLLEAVFVARAGDSPSAWPSHRFPPGLSLAHTILDQRATRRGHDPQRLAALVERLATQTAASNLTLVWCLRQHFTEPDSAHILLRDGRGVDLRRTVHVHISRLIANVYAGRPDEFAAQFVEAPRGLLRWICDGFAPTGAEAAATAAAAEAVAEAQRRAEEQEANSQDAREAREQVATLTAQAATAVRIASEATAFENEAWRPFAELIIDASRRQPNVMLPPLTWLVTDSVSMSHGDPGWKYNEVVDSRLFSAGNRARDLCSGPEREDLAADGAYQAIRREALAAGAPTSVA